EPSHGAGLRASLGGGGNAGRKAPAQAELLGIAWFLGKQAKLNQLRPPQPNGHVKPKVPLYRSLRASQGPIQRDFRLHMAVRLRRPELIELRLLPQEPSDSEELSLSWRLSSGVSSAAETRPEASSVARL